MLSRLKALGVDVNTLTRHASLQAARGFAVTFDTIRIVVIGDDCRYWVVSARDAARLRKAGYETA